MACMIAIAFFPHHYKEILDVAKQFFPNIENYRSSLEMYEKHLEEQGISSSSNYITLETYRDDTLIPTSAFLDVSPRESRFFGHYNGVSIS